ncbi:MAG: DUF1326 domain-containing protein [Acidimicrobiia bacterium]|nr:DUF1326 domain-containing protein [Acidimicrobiia bacterium]
MIQWKIRGENMSSCNCDWGCPCQFNAHPTHGTCEAIVGFRIAEGHFGDVDLSGVLFAAAAKWPGPLHEGNGTILLVADNKCTPAQIDSLLQLASGKNGGSFFEIISAVCPNVLEPKVAAITFQADRDKRTGTLHVDGVGHSKVEPIKNPVTGEEHRARINLPNGFEYETAEVGNTVHFTVTSPDAMKMEYSNCHAHLCEINWSNQAA